MSQIKYQVFISSTYDDLGEERSVVIRSILEMGHIPVGMEMFSAADDEQWAIIKRVIEESDYYVVIVAHRYGSEVDGVSYTEKEYDFAVEKGIPTLRFVIHKDAKWSDAKRDQGNQAKSKLEKLRRFKEKLKTRPVGWWKSADDLYGTVSIALMKQMTAVPRIGWIRGDNAPSQQMASELARLSGENSRLRASIEELTRQVATEEKSKISETIEALYKQEYAVDLFFEGAKAFEKAPEPLKLYDLYVHVAPAALVEISSNDVAQYISMLANKTERTLRKLWPVPKNYTDTIMSMYFAMDLILPSKRKHGLNDSRKYWTLSAFGQSVLKEIRHRNALATADGKKGSSKPDQRTKS